MARALLAFIADAADDNDAASFALPQELTTSTLGDDDAIIDGEVVDDAVSTRKIKACAANPSKSDDPECGSEGDSAPFRSPEGRPWAQERTPFGCGSESPSPWHKPATPGVMSR